MIIFCCMPSTKFAGFVMWSRQINITWQWLDWTKEPNIFFFAKNQNFRWKFFLASSTKFAKQSRKIACNTFKDGDKKNQMAKLIFELHILIFNSQSDICCKITYLQIIHYQYIFAEVFSKPNNHCFNKIQKCKYNNKITKKEKSISLTPIVGHHLSVLWILVQINSFHFSHCFFPPICYIRLDFWWY